MVCHGRIADRVLHRTLRGGSDVAEIVSIGLHVILDIRERWKETSDRNKIVG
jgi:hypothetical protein